jgi:hypothetical protein
MTEQEMRKVLFIINETPKLNVRRCPGVQDTSNAKEDICANLVPVDPTAKLGRPPVPRRRPSSHKDDHKDRYLMQTVLDSAPQLTTKIGENHGDYQPDKYVQLRAEPSTCRNLILVNLVYVPENREVLCDSVPAPLRMS